MINKFVSFLAEEKNASIPHLRHLAGESHFYSKNESDKEIDRLEQLHKYLNNEPSKVESISIKADGSPAFNIGHLVDPNDGKFKFGIAYKGAARGWAFSHEDVDRLYSHNPTLQNKMHQLLDHGSKVVRPQHGIIQGDFMGSKENGTIADEGNKVKFKENTIKYGIDKNSDEGKKLKKAKISLALHTRIDDGHQEYNLLPDKFPFHNDVHIFNNRATRSMFNYDDQKKNTFNLHFNKAKQHLDQIEDHDNLVAGHTDHLQTYINNTVKENVNPTVSGYRKHVAEKLQKEVDKVKRPGTKTIKKKALDEAVMHVDLNNENFKHLFKAHQHLDTAKNALVSAMDEGQQHYEHTIKNEPTKPEGYVVKFQGGNSLDNVAKAVNRGEFSRKNFLDESI